LQLQEPPQSATTGGTAPSQTAVQAPVSQWTVTSWQSSGSQCTSQGPPLQYMSKLPLQASLPHSSLHE